MKNYYNKVLLLTFILLMITGCKTNIPKRQLSKDHLILNITKSYAWFNLEPSIHKNITRNPLIEVELSIENNVGYDLSNLHVHNAKVIQNNEIVAYYDAKFYIDDTKKMNSCFDTTIIRRDSMELKDKCKAEVILYINRNTYREVAEIDRDKPISVIFFIENEEIKSVEIETNSMNFEFAY